jgi:hypothetical protein
MWNSSADIQAEQETIIENDVEQPVEALVPVYLQETIEPEHDNDQVVSSELLLIDEQDIFNTNNQVIVAEITNVQDALVMSNIKKDQDEIEIEEIIIDLFNKAAVHK